MKVKSQSEVAQSYPTLSDPMDCSPPGSSIHGIFQARVLEWGAIAFSEEMPRKGDNAQKGVGKDWKYWDPLKGNCRCFFSVRVEWIFYIIKN